MGSTRKVWPKLDRVLVRNREFHQGDLVLIRSIIRRNPAWGRTRLSQELCRRWEWIQENGRWKERACRVALVRLESLGYLVLPIRQTETGGKPPFVESSTEKTHQTPIRSMPSFISAKLVSSKSEARVWNNAVATHHYLGLAASVGRTIRYLLYGDGELVGAISYSDCAWMVNARERALETSGLDSIVSRDRIIANNRFLIFPWVEVPNLASRFLGLTVRCIREDWEDKYNIIPLMAETFVDPEFFLGTCYRAAGWVYVGDTRGYAKRGASHEFRSKPKLMFLRGLSSEIQRKLELCSLGKVA